MKVNKHFKQLFKFFLISLGGGAIMWSIYAIFIWSTHANQKTIRVAGHAVAMTIACIFSFTINRKWTFRNSSNPAIQMPAYLAFYAVIIVGTTFFSQWMMRDRNVNAFVTELIIQVIVFTCDFCFSKFILFRKWGSGKKKSDAADSPEQNKAQNSLCEAVQKPKETRKSKHE